MALKNDKVAKLLSSILAVLILSQTLNGFCVERLTDSRDYNLVLAEETSFLTDDELAVEIKKLGIDTTKKIADFTQAEIDKLAKLVPKRFVDVKGDEWYVRDLAVMMAKGIVVGSTDGKFNPSDNVTRAQFYAMWSRALKNTPIEEVTRVWSRDEVIKYLTNGSVGLQVQCTDPRGKLYSLVNPTPVWYARYMKDIISIPYGRYMKSDMEKPIKRGEVSFVIYADMTWRELTEAEQNKMFSVRYFKDTPLLKDTISKAECQSRTMTQRFAMETDFASTLWYPVFENVVSGKDKMPDYVLRAINALNYQGILVGDGVSNSNWKDNMTRAQAVALLVRAFNKAQRIPVDKRVKEIIN